MSIDLLFGDCSLLLKSVETESIDLIVTDPPYGKNYKSNRQGEPRNFLGMENDPIHFQTSKDRLEK